jgi:hypothetical protein
MIWIIALLALALYVIFIMCLLTIGSQADDRKEELFDNRFDLSSNDGVASSSMPASPECMPGTSARRQGASFASVPG